MALRGKEEVQLQHLLNNLGYNLLQFGNRMTDLIVSGSPELSLIARTQLMTSLGLLSMKTMELCQAWEQFEYAYKSTGIPWPHDFDVDFPKKHAEEEEEDKVIGKKRGVKEPKPKKLKRKHTGDTVVGPKKTFKKDDTKLSKKKKQHGISDPCIPLGGHSFGNRGGGTRPFVRIRCLVRVLSFSMVVLPSKIFSFQVASRLLECPGPGGDRRRDGCRFPDGGQSMGHLFVRLGCLSQGMERF